MDVNDEWSRFLNHDYETSHILVKSEPGIVPECSPIVISTKTKIIYLNQPIDLFTLFWNLPMISYDTYGEGIIKKQIKFNFTKKEEVEEFEENIKKVDTYKFVTILNQFRSKYVRVDAVHFSTVYDN